MNPFLAAAAAVSGVGVGLAIGPSDGHAALALAVGLACVAAVTTSRRVRLVASALVLMTLAIGLAARAQHGLVEHPLPVHQSATLRGALIGDPDATRFSAKFLLRVDRIDERAVADRVVLVRTSGEVAQRLAFLESGDEVEMRGSLQPLTGFDERRKWEHAVAQFSARRIIDVQLADAWHWRIANGVRSVIVRGTAALPASERALMLGFLLGDTRSIPRAVVDDFRASGLSHLLAVSGANLAFLFAGCAPLLQRLGRRPQLVAMAVIVVLFGAMTRWEPSVVRASAMVAVAIVARFVGRPQVAARGLAVAVTALVLIDPFLVMRVGFLLSVGACCGLVFVTPWLLARATRWPAVVSDGVCTTAGAIVGTAPIQLGVFGTVPLVAIPANLVAGASAASLTVWGFAASLAAGVVPALGHVVQFPSQLMLRAQMAIAAIAARNPMALDRRAVVGLVAVGAFAAVVARRRKRSSPVHPPEPPA